MAFLFVVTTTYAELPVKVDFAVFKFNDSLNLIEVYYSFPDNCLIYNKGNEINKGAIGFAIGILNNKVLIDSAQWVQEVNIPVKEKEYVSDLVGLKTMLVPKGMYKLKFIAVDMLNKNNRFKKTFDLNSYIFPDDKLCASDLQIASIIERQDRATQKWNQSFKKNSLFVVPEPGRDIVGSSPKIYSYLEIYNAKKLHPQGLKITYSVYNAAHKNVFSISRNKKSYSNAMVEYISIPVDALPTGVYYYTVEIESATNKSMEITITKKMYVSNYEIPPSNETEFYESKDFEQSEFATLSEKQVETQYDQIKFLATDYEQEVWNKCETLGAKQRFLFTFWTSRNKDTTLPYNQALEDFRSRVRYANKHFKYGLMKEGWRTPRGRVYLKYGNPTRIERFVQEGEKPAYEKWYYDELQGGVHFVFIDFRSNGYYQLVHSTAEGEMYNYNWYEQYILKQDPDANFQYQKQNNWER